MFNDKLKYLIIYSYACRLNENSGQGTTLVFGDGYVMQVHDDGTVIQNSLITLISSKSRFRVEHYTCSFKELRMF